MDGAEACICNRTVVEDVWWIKRYSLPYVREQSRHMRIITQLNWKELDVFIDISPYPRVDDGSGPICISITGERFVATFSYLIGFVQLRETRRAKWRERKQIKCNAHHITTLQSKKIPAPDRNTVTI